MMVVKTLFSGSMFAVFHMDRKIRVLLAKTPMDAHNRGAKIIAAGLRDSGMEVIYVGSYQTPE